MEIQRISCASCEAPISVPSDIDTLTCEFCGTNFIIKRNDGHVTLGVAEDVKRAIQEVGEQTNSFIRESSEATQLELKRIQLQQELSSLQIQILDIQTEIRSLEQGKKGWKKKKRLKELSKRKDKLTTQMQSIQDLLRNQISSVEHVTASVKQSSIKAGNVAASVPETTKKQSSIKSGCLVGCLVYLLVGVCLTMIAVPLDNALFGSLPDGTNGAGPLASIAAFIGLAAGIVAFYFHAYPESWLWKSIKQKFFGKNMEKN